jgi:methionyl-tRNA formyltransferase
LKKIVVLTTETPHHLFYLQEMMKFHAIAGVVVERTSLAPKFETKHPFESERDEYEWSTFFDGKRLESKEIVSSSVYVDDVNSPEASKQILEWAPDITLVFGTRRIQSSVIDSIPGSILNLHGGDPALYRGLDSHLWAIYHKDFGNLVTTLHTLTYDLDAGDIVGKLQLPLVRNMRLAHLRAINTRACIDLCKDAIHSAYQPSGIPRYKQPSVGRYYSFMPSCLKELCVGYFEKHTRAL